MRIALVASLAVLAAAPPARGEGPRPTIAPMTRADGEVCDLLRAQVQDRCKRVARDGFAAVYQSGSEAGSEAGSKAGGEAGSKAGSKAAGIRRLVLAIDTGRDVLIGPAVDVLSDQLQSTRSTLRAIAIDGHPGVALHVVSTWKRGKAAEHSASLVGCAPVGEIWKCSLLDVGPCDASLTDDGSVTTSCGASATLSIAGAR